MLILSRKLDERIMIGDQIEIAVVDIRGDQVKLGIAAPSHIKVYRKEVYQAIQQENIQAVKAQPSALPEWDRVVDRLGEAGRRVPRGSAKPRGSANPPTGANPPGEPPAESGG
ncbi:MAG: carbon storage regulator CsrA [Spirochaetales bacterium]|nr:carbon storage regulator CsrA [Spirochaetales bacterium]